MKLVALLLALGLFEVMGVASVAMSADASAQSAFTARSPSLSAAVTAAIVPIVPKFGAANSTANAPQFDFESLQIETPRKSAKKRSRNRCARITTTCWSAA